VLSQSLCAQGVARGGLECLGRTEPAVRQAKDHRKEVDSGNGRVHLASALSSRDRGAFA
jgi:hypothetical protein